jgi:hypothetical protein
MLRVGHARPWDGDALDAAVRARSFPADYCDRRKGSARHAADAEAGAGGGRCAAGPVDFRELPRVLKGGKGSDDAAGARADDVSGVADVHVAAGEIIQEPPTLVIPARLGARRAAHDYQAAMNLVAVDFDETDDWQPAFGEKRHLWRSPGRNIELRAAPPAYGRAVD